MFHPEKMAGGRAIDRMLEHNHKLKLNNSLDWPIKTVNAVCKFITGTRNSGISSAINTAIMMLIGKKEVTL